MNQAETRVLLAALDAARAQGQAAAIATVVRVRGSAYRREGTRMLVLENGAQVCMLSGGCLEAEVVETALDVIASHEPQVVHYDLSEDATWGLGLGCGGSVDVRIARLDDDEVTTGWLAALRSGEAAALILPLEDRSELHGQVLVTANGTLGSLSDPAVQEAAVAAARHRLAARDPRAGVLTLEGGGELFIDVNAPAPELLIYGAGHDAVPLCAQAVALGYRVTVADARSAFLTPARFPGATLLTLAPDELMDGLILNDRTQAVIMNHHLDRDRLCLHHALNSPAPYVGVLGPRSRYLDLSRDLAAEARPLTPEQDARVRSPVGLGLGAEAPEEVAMSILAELMAWRRGGDGRPLNGHRGAIHQTYEGRRES